MKRRLLKIFGIVLSALIVTNCATNVSKEEQPNDEDDIVETTIKVYGFHHLSNVYKLEDFYDMPIAFFDKDKAIPYIAMDNIYHILNISSRGYGVIDYRNFYSITSNNHIYTIKKNGDVCPSTLTINFLSGSVSYSNFQYFFSSGYLGYDPLDVTFGIAVGAHNFVDINSNPQYTPPVEPFTNNFKDYGFELKTIDGKDYMPFKVATDILKYEHDLDYVYNGQKFYQFGNDLSSTISADAVENFKQEFISSWSIDFNNHNFLNYSFRELCFELSQIYGLRNGSTRYDRKIDNFYSYFKDKHFKLSDGSIDPLTCEERCSNSARDFNIGCCELFGQGIADGGHTKIREMLIKSSGLNRDDYYDLSMNYTYDYELYAARNEAGIAHEDTNTKEQIIDKEFQYFTSAGEETTSLNVADTMFCTYDKFNGQLVDGCVNVLKTVNEYVNIKNIVFDLSCNTGGSIPNAVVMMTLLNGGCSMRIKDGIAGGVSRNDSIANVNLDEDEKSHYPIYDENDHLPARIHSYIITTKQTFSCGNCLAFLAKDVNAATILGSKSGGGCCAVSFGVTPLGTIFSYANAKMVCVENEEGEFIDDDLGAEVDYPIPDFDKDNDNRDDYYDRSNIVKQIINTK